MHPGPHFLLLWWALWGAGREHAALLKFQHNSASTLQPFCIQKHNGDGFFLPREQLSNEKLESPGGVVDPHAVIPIPFMEQGCYNSIFLCRQNWKYRNKLWRTRMSPVRINI